MPKGLSAAIFSSLPVKICFTSPAFHEPPVGIPWPGNQPGDRVAGMGVHHCGITSGENPEITPVLFSNHWKLYGKIIEFPATPRFNSLPGFPLEMPSQYCPFYFLLPPLRVAARNRSGGQGI